MDRKMVEEQRWPLIEAALLLSRLLGVFCALWGVAILAGYLTGYAFWYRPVAEGPATNPLTALSVLLLGLGFGLGGRQGTGQWLARCCALVVVAITVLRLAEFIAGVELTAWISPFQQTVLAERRMGLGNSMGVNSAAMLAVIAGSLALPTFRMWSATQVTAFIASSIPAVSLAGYGYGLVNFYGQMSLVTAIAGFLLSLASLGAVADSGALRAMLSPYVGGRIARLQWLLSMVIVLTIGWAMVKSFGGVSSEVRSVITIFSVVMCWLMTVMASVFANYQETVDVARRETDAELAAAAQIDALTGLPNRRRFFEMGAKEIERIARYGGSLWVLMIDIDHFKKVNDTGGHGLGDRVLTEVAMTVARSVRKVDVVGRVGGEEFAVLLTNTTRAGCRGVAENIRTRVAALSVPDWTPEHGPTTISVGCAQVGADDRLDESLHRADTALYLAKNNGRNQIVFHEEAPTARSATVVPHGAGNADAYAIDAVPPPGSRRDDLAPDQPTLKLASRRPAGSQDAEARDSTPR